VILKIVPKACLECSLEKSTSEREGKPVQKFDAAFRTILRISQYFQRSKQKLCIYFYLERERLKLLKPFEHVQKLLI
jgi:hypothetical protein